jgi:nucleoside 2-deoxyribosyltransferase
MSQQNPIRLFVTHTWQLADDYLRVFEYIESVNNFYYRNTSTPDRAAPGSGTEAVRDELRRQINSAEIMIALAGLYDDQPELTVFQMNYAQSQKKPVVLLPKFGAAAQIPKLLQDRADELVNWEKRGLVNAIRRLARHEQTAVYDTIEFNSEDFKNFKLD